MPTIKKIDAAQMRLNQKMLLKSLIWGAIFSVTILLMVHLPSASEPGPKTEPIYFFIVQGQLTIYGFVPFATTPLY